MSRARLVVLIALALVFATAGAVAETIMGLPLHINKLDSGALRIWVGDHISSTATVAIPTSKGIVIIDTTGEPAIDRELRRIIARELGRDDFAMLINTHEHGDHTGGNAIYSDCTIVGHELIAEGMERELADRQRRIEWNIEYIAQLKNEIAALEENAPEAARLREALIIEELQLKEWQSNPAPSVPPTKTFSNRLELDLGDTRFELFYIGGMHSASDIAVLVPKHRLLLTGDTMADVWLTETPGCLASFGARSGIRHNFPLLIEDWNILLGRKDDIGTILTGHWNGEITWAGFEARVKYIETLWQGVQAAEKSPEGMDALFVGYLLRDRFPALAGSPGCSESSNQMTISEMWTVLTGQTSAADELFRLIDQQAGEAEIRSVVDQRRAKSPSYFFRENYINYFGYVMLREGRVEQATALFRINVELFPDSWNVYDSLGEALLAAGDREGAIAMYEKSLALNPGNTNGRDAIQRIRGESRPDSSGTR